MEPGSFSQSSQPGNGTALTESSTGPPTKSKAQVTTTLIASDAMFFSSSDAFQNTELTICHKLEASKHRTEFTDLSREWSVSNQFLHSIRHLTPNIDGEIPIWMANRGARDMMPMERWMKEGERGSPWNNVRSVPLAEAHRDNAKQKHQ